MSLINISFCTICKHDQEFKIYSGQLMKECLKCKSTFPVIKSNYRVCSFCGVGFETQRPNSKYCSYRCHRDTERKKKSEKKKNDAKRIKKCMNAKCNKEYMPRVSNQKYCTTICRKAHERTVEGKYPRIACPICERVNIKRRGYIHPCCELGDCYRSWLNKEEARFKSLGRKIHENSYKYIVCLTCNNEFIAFKGNDKKKYCSKACQENSPVKRKQKREYKLNRARNRKYEIVMLMGGKCCECGYNKNIYGLDFHHRDPEQKMFELNSNNLLRRANVEILEEAKKCDLLCSNCHREHHNEDGNAWLD